MPTDIGLQKDDWQYEYIETFNRGLNLSKRADLLSPEELTEAENIFYEKAQIRVDTGYIKFGQVVRGQPRLDFQFFKTNGTNEFVLITNSTFYKWVAANSQWQYVSDSNSTAATDGEPAGEVNLVVDSIAGFSDTDFIGVTLDNGAQHQTTINGAPSGSTIIMTDAVPAGRTVPVAAAVVKAVDLTGDDDIQISAVTLTFSDWFVFTNGVEKPKRYDGTDCVDIPNLPSSGNTLCRAVALYSDHLILLFTTEGGTRKPQRVRWSNTADASNWSTGNAGFIDLFDSEDFIVGSAKLGPYNIIYRERSIVRQEFVGTDQSLFNFDTMVTGEGALSHDSITDLGSSHIFVGNSNVYEYKGGFGIDPVGDNIFDKVFGQDGELDPSFKKRTFTIYVEELDELWIFYPSSASVSGYPDKVLKLRFLDDAWLTRVFPVNIAGFGFYLKSSTTRWLDLVGDWVSQAFTWGSAKLLANAPTTHLMNAEALQVLEYNYTAGNDDGTAIAWKLETKEWHNPKFNTRVDSIDFLAAGTSVLVEYSTDRGVSWNTYVNLAIDASMTRREHHKQIVGRSLRWRLSGSGAGFRLGWFGFMSQLEDAN